MANTGKIGRLPGHLRETINRTLQAGCVGLHLLERLNKLPEVQDALARNFGGRKINLHNLSEWKKRGFRDWLFRDNIIGRAIALHARDLPQLLPRQTGPTANLTPEQLGQLEQMSISYRGKIGHLPSPLRHELNRRLWNGENGTRLIKWLNALPEVQAILIRDFRGRPINAVNLTKWRAGGYRDWCLQQDIAQKRLALARQTRVGNLTSDFSNDQRQTEKQTAGRVI